MPRIDELRLYYNTTIRPELLRLERLRRQLIREIIISVISMVAVVALFFVLNLGFLVLILGVPIIFYLGTLYFRAEKFRQAFKPAIVKLLLEFLNLSPNFQDLSYDATKSINQDRFERSGLFRPTPDLYHAEDYIRGMVGEMAFEMGEAYVREISPASTKLQAVFSGLFVHAIFGERTTGRVAVWPKTKLRRLKRTVDAYVAKGGRNADIEIMNPQFRERFAVYAHGGTHVAGILTPPMQDALVDFALTQENELYFAVHNQDLFIGVAHDYDLLEPSFWRPNVSFGLVRKFYTDIVFMLETIQVFDQNH
ncbi:DUF3137 domain-containing protein [Neolewinella antarctica]|uniref:DUF3137 domain-containing protein n=1 Tax=Neolewinella antarctica TaxID=442734 RepID=UPI0029FED8E2|nr:DUF3137 domain-containing protein [Neolewinella antarctica]